MNSSSGKVLAFIGSYAPASEPGIYACGFDTSRGDFEVLDRLSGFTNPTFLAVNEERGIVYALEEGIDAEGKRYGTAAAIAFSRDNGKLTLLNREATVSSPICHIVLDQSQEWLIVSSYHGGMVGLLPVTDDGRVGPIADIHRHQGGSGVSPAQTQARAHSAFIDPSNRFVVVSDLGADRIVIYRLDASARKLVPHGETTVAPGAGPRHFAFHPSLPCGYVINELNATITAFAFDQEAGTLTETQTISTLPSSYDGENACADIHISPDGRYLYGSNRGHDSIAVFAIDGASGRLSSVEFAPTLGGHPRNFALSRDGKFLLAANRDGNNIVSFRRDAATGKLTATGAELALSKPVCIRITGASLL